MRTIGCQRIYGDDSTFYYWDNDSTTKKIVIKDIDLDSPSYNQIVIGEI